MAQHIVVTDYNPEWERMFEEEARAFREILGDNCVDIQHIGSTAVPGLAAKPVIDIMPDQLGVKMGGTMRLGAYPCRIAKGTKMEKAYGKKDISERHRHRFEFNNEYREEFEKAGMKIAGTSPDGRLVEAVEIPAHPFFVGVQFHPEFKSRPNSAHPLFREFIRAAVQYAGKCGRN